MSATAIGLRRYLSTDGFRDLVRGVKDPKSAIDTATLALLMAMPTKVRALGGADSRLVEFVITSDRVDREQDTLSPEGWNFDDYQNNPVVLWAHDHSAMPIGNSRSLTKKGNTITSICEFTPAELCGGFGYMVYQMYVNDFMHACSVGFQPVEYTYAEERRYGINYIKQDLLEYSCVPVPANPDALALARGKGISLAPMKEWAERVLDESRSEGKTLTDDGRRRVEALRAASSPNGRSLILELGDMKMAGTATDKTDAPAVPASTVKKVERFECKTTGHLHATEQEATDCDLPENLLTAAEASLTQLRGMTTLTVAQQDKLKALTPAPAKDAPATEPVAEDNGLAIEFAEETPGEVNILAGLTEDELRAAITGAVDAGLAKAMGRVD